MKRFELDLSKYQVDGQEVKDDGNGGKKIVVVKADYPLRGNISSWLRAPGVFKSGEEISEAVTLAKAIRDCDTDVFSLDTREAEILKKGVNRHIEITADGKSNLGGPVHEEAICRIFGMKEVD